MFKLKEVVTILEQQDQNQINLYLYYMSQQIIITEKQLKMIGVRLDEQNNSIRAYSFDWDDNILNMPTQIHLEKKFENIYNEIQGG